MEFTGDVNALLACSSMWTSLRALQKKTGRAFCGWWQSQRERAMKTWGTLWEHTIPYLLHRVQKPKIVGEGQQTMLSLWQWKERDTEFLPLKKGQECMLHLEQLQEGVWKGYALKIQGKRGCQRPKLNKNNWECVFSYKPTINY